MKDCYINEAQITSGTHTYAMGSGCVVVSTPYWHATELLSENKGCLFEAMKQNAKEKEFPFLYLFEDGQEIYPAYGTIKTLVVFLIDADKILRYHGAIDDSPRNSDGVEEKFVEQAIKAIEAGNDLETTMTKAVVCGIK